MTVPGPLHTIYALAGKVHTLHFYEKYVQPVSVFLNKKENTIKKC